MSKIFSSIFRQRQNDLLIGAVHFPPLSGYPDSPGREVALQNALQDSKVFESNGFDAIIIENNYDLPHTEFVSPEVAEDLSYLAGEIRKQISIPLGISVLWNDYRTAFSVAKAAGLEFIRLPVFVDTAKTNYGTVVGNPSEVTSYRSSVGAENVGLFTDIHVKHSEILSTYSIEESARLAFQNGADAVIVTGKWTGDAPNTDDLTRVRSAIGDAPIVCGSGVNDSNCRTLFAIANGAIVSTSVKEDTQETDPTNVRPYSARIDARKARQLREASTKL